MCLQSPSARLRVLSIAVMTLTAVPSTASAVGCCSAGTPILGGLDNVSNQPHSLLISATQEIRVLRALFDGSKKLDDRTRERRVLGTLLEAGYGINRYLSLSMLAGYIRQERWIKTNNGGRSHSTGQGFGDLIVLPKIHILRATIKRPDDLAIGAGIKMPTGPYTLREGGLLVAPELQPGSGSWDPVFWGLWSRTLLPSPWTVLATMSARIPTENPRGYRFGPEALAGAGVSFGTAAGVDTSLLIRLRSTRPDRFQGDRLPNTGSLQLFAVPAVNIIRFSPWALRAALQIPLWRSVTGTQLAETIQARLSLAVDIHLPGKRNEPDGRTR